MHPSIQVTTDTDEAYEKIETDSLYLRLSLLEFLGNIKQRVGDVIYQDAPLYKKLIDEAADTAQKVDTWHIARDTYLKGLRYIDTDSLAPLAHHTIEGSYRVPVKITKERYRIYIDKGSSRLFKGETIPPHILSKLVMAKSVCKHYELDKDMYMYDLYLCKGNPDMSDIAWRASESMYIVVLTDAELTELKGGKK